MAIECGKLFKLCLLLTSLVKSCLFEGLRRTARHHFAGGDTAWEERKLGKYATSETRFIETMEDICHKSSLKNTDRFNGLADLEAKCAFLVEEHEDIIEEFYYKHQSSNMSTWLCVRT
ncbi:hypothetical protein COOONC_19898 [Cooperia oncophora]